MIEMKHSCVGMRCPVCSKKIIEFINVFQFASGFNFRCPDCNSPLFSFGKDSKKGNFSLNCFACGDNHTFKISKKSFFSDKLASFGCKENIVDVLFTGPYDMVFDALEQLSQELKSLSDKYYQSMEQQYGKYLSAAIKIIEEKAKEKRIICLCGSYEFNLKFEKGGIHITCGKCGASEFIPAENEEDLNVLINRRSILLK
ncbi:MAG: hypothetical protein IKW02_02110 [Clostridia bacterium]|nr:hypothetical protein [Clostridia bacterium]